MTLGALFCGTDPDAKAQMLMNPDLIHLCPRRQRSRDGLFSRGSCRD